MAFIEGVAFAVGVCFAEIVEKIASSCRALVNIVKDRL